MQLENFLRSLSGMRKGGAGFAARCAAHDDSRAGLSVVEGDGRVLFTCFACGFDGVVSIAREIDAGLSCPVAIAAGEVGSVEDYMHLQKVLLKKAEQQPFFGCKCCKDSRLFVPPAGWNKGGTKAEQSGTRPTSKASIPIDAAAIQHALVKLS